jgi:hypothetical protein
MKSDQFLNETTSGAIASVSMPLGKTQKRAESVEVKGLKPVGKKTSSKNKGPYANSIVEGIETKKVSEAELQEDDLIIIPGQKLKRRNGFVPKDQSRVDHEVEMARSDLIAAFKNAKSIFQMLKDRSEEEGIEGWVQEKLIKANDYLNAVKEYYDGKMMREMSGGVIAAGGVGESSQSWQDEFADMIGQMKKSGRLGMPKSNYNFKTPEPKSKEELMSRLKELEAEFDLAYQQSDDYSFWKKQNDIASEISSIKRQLRQQGVAEGKWSHNAITGQKLDPRTGEILPVKEKPLTMKQMFAPKAQPKLTLDDVWRKVENVVSQIYPDGDPNDYMAPWLEKHGIRDFKIGEILDRAAKKNGYKDMYDYWNSMGEQGVAEGSFSPQEYGKQLQTKINQDAINKALVLKKQKQNLGNKIIADIVKQQLAKKGVAEGLAQGNYNVGLEDIGKPVTVDGESGHVLLSIGYSSGNGKLTAHILQPDTGSKGIYDLETIGKGQQGVAEAIDLAEGKEETIKKKIQAKLDALSLAREQRRGRGNRQQGPREIKLQADIDNLSNELRQLNKPGVTEAIKGWKHAHSDMMKHRAESGKDVHLVSLKKDGTESKMHDAKKSFKSEEEARAHHKRVKELNPNRTIAHNLYVGGKVEKLS